MNTLTEDSTASFLERFYSFHDAVLRTIDVGYSEDGTKAVAITIATRDANEQDNDGWVSVVLRLEQVSEYSFREEANQGLQVLSDGIHVLWFENHFGVDFGWLMDEPDSLAELRTSKAYACAQAATWSVESY